LDGDRRITGCDQDCSGITCILTSIRIIAEQTTENLQTQIV
jgi:hypothetical protein